MNTLRKILFPFAVLYHGITAFRNFLYQYTILPTTKYEKPVICVGNLSVGGTGKSPMIEFLISILKENHKIAVLSRGYKRKTKGFQYVEVHHTAEEVGDEPLQIKKKFPEVVVAVDANRRRGMAFLIPNNEVILLDDAFQHRKVQPSFNILLTTYSNLYIKDYLLPTGNLRESRAGAARADVIVVTKCPPGMAYAEQQKIQYDLKIKDHQHVYFSAIRYANFIKNASVEKPLESLLSLPFTLVTGIANAKPMVEFLQEYGCNFTHKEFADHHPFSEAEIEKLQKEKCIVTTEKDYMRLQYRLTNVALFYLPIELIILNKAEGFINRIKEAAIKN